MTRVGRLLQLDELTWSTVPFQALRGRLMTVLFAFGIMAWNRYGLLTFVSPRAAVQLVLIGLYGWLAIAAVFWALGRRRVEEPASFHNAAVASGIVHVPLVALSLFIAIVAGFARILGPGAIVAALVVLLWMPAIIATALRTVAGLAWQQAVPLAILVQVAWAAGPGWRLYDEVGHLL